METNFKGYSYTEKFELIVDVVVMAAVVTSLAVAESGVDDVIWTTNKKYVTNSPSNCTHRHLRC